MTEQAKRIASQAVDYAYGEVLAKADQLTEDFKPYVRKLADEATNAASESAAAQKAKQELKDAFVQSTMISVAASFLAAFAAEAWEMWRKGSRR